MGGNAMGPVALAGLPLSAANLHKAHGAPDDIRPAILR